MKGPDKDRPLSRRELFSIFRRRPEPADDRADAAEPAPEARAEPAPQGPLHVRDPSLPAPLRPPGAIDEQLLADTCHRCGKCAEACPEQAIRALPERYGPWAGTPFLIARERACVVCADTPCAAACPTGALRLPDGVIDMGTAARDWQRCQAFWGTPCDACFRACPRPGAIRLDSHGHPHVDSMKCVGCGLCEKACPMEPSAIVVRPRSE